jgi:HD-like signal output (HDOD) protein
MSELIRLEKVLSEVRDLPTLPTVLTSISEAINDPETSALDLAKIIAVDQSLSATLLRIVNSAYYGFYRSVDSITDAVVILGFNQVRDLVLTAKVFEALQGAAEGLDMADLWHHSLACAIACERAGNMLRLSKSTGFYSAGLLHDVGKVVMHRVDATAHNRAIDQAIRDGVPLWQAEKTLFGFDHAHAGGLLADCWFLPEPIVEAIRLHHEPGKSQTDSVLPHAACVANVAAHEAGYGDGSYTNDLESARAAQERLGMPGEMYALLVEEVANAREKLDSLLGVLNA